MNVQLERRIELEEALRSAVFADDLYVLYQPQIDLSSGRVCGLEALARWHRPGIGDISPKDFIEIAEDSGLIIELGRRVTAMVCRQIRLWMDAGVAVPVSINVSPVQISHGSVDAMILEALETAGLPGWLIEVEVTESGLIDDTSRTQEMVSRLLQSGVRLSIDDFLTGYSNFAYLRQFRPAHLKIDQSFVSSLVPGGENEAIVRAAIQMAEVLGIPTIAEGVETDVQAMLLRASGCTIGQGYLFSRPIDVDAATALLERGVNQPVWLPVPDLNPTSAEALGQIEQYTP
jgi:EAL domain-containing protein (putative c-di-GMP-specific phosphodiesterase class I)